MSFLGPKRVVGMEEEQPHAYVTETETFGGKITISPCLIADSVSLPCFSSYIWKPFSYLASNSGTVNVRSYGFQTDILYCTLFTDRQYSVFLYIIGWLGMTF